MPLAGFSNFLLKCHPEKLCLTFSISKSFKRTSPYFPLRQACSGKDRSKVKWGRRRRRRRGRLTWLMTRLKANSSMNDSYGGGSHSFGIDPFPFLYRFDYDQLFVTSFVLIIFIRFHIRTCVEWRNPRVKISMPCSRFFASTFSFVFLVLQTRRNF